MRKYKKIMIILGAIILMFFSMFLTDYVRVKNVKAPIFAIKVSGDQEIEKLYVGMFYFVEYHQEYQSVSPEDPPADVIIIVNYEIYPWWDKLDHPWP
ncbi:MAG: hypothetical protein AB7E61_03910 [Acholeplasmataceae bacterium]